MAKEKINLRNELRLYKFDFDLLQKIPCSKKDNKKYEKLLKDGGVLPEGVFAYGYESGDASTTEFYTVYEADLTEAEIGMLVEGDKGKLSFQGTRYLGFERQ